MAVLCGMPTIQYSAGSTRLHLMGGCLGPIRVLERKRHLDRFRRYSSNRYTTHESLHCNTDRHFVSQFRKNLADGRGKSFIVPVCLNFDVRLSHHFQ